MRNRKSYILFLAILLLTLFSCASGAVKSPSSSPSLNLEITAIGNREAWETEWERTVAIAKKEGNLILYSTAGTGVRNAVADLFTSKYGIKIDITAGRGGEISARLLQERRAGIYLADVYVGGATTLVNTIKPTGMLEPLNKILILPEVLNPKAWNSGDLPWIDKDQTILYLTSYVTPPVGINTKLVKPDEIKSYNDLLNPKWKGKIVINDPTVEGSGHKILSVLGWEIMSIDFLRQLARQDPLVIRDERLLTEWLAHGKYSIAVPPKKDTANEFIRAGAPIDFIIPKEGSYLATGSGQISLINRAPHPYTARVFINWLLSREGGTAFSDGYGVQSARVDVSTQNLDPIGVRQAGMKYFFGGSEDFLLKGPQMTELHKEVFGPLIRN